jgi:heme exporter protein CcmD
MGGYGLYVWGSYGVTFFLLFMEMMLLRKRSRQAR